MQAACMKASRSPFIFLLLAAIIPSLMLGDFLLKFPTPSSLAFFSRGTSRRDKCWAETVVHPTLLWHPFPRKVLIVGGGTKVLVKECLRHFATTPINWVDSSSTDLTPEEDILGRTLRHPVSSAETLLAASTSNSTFDVIILDNPTPKLLFRAADQLDPGGVLAVALPDSLEQFLEQILGLFKEVHVFMPYDSVGRSSYYALATNSDAYPPPTHLSVSYINAITGRRVAPKAALEHFDGEVHLGLFLLQRQFRNRLQVIYRKSCRPVSTVAHLTPAIHSLPPSIVTTTQDFVGCGSVPCSEEDAVDLVLQALKNGQAIPRDVRSKSWNACQNTTTCSMATELDTDTVEVGPVFNWSAPISSSSRVHITVTVIFDNGSLELHILPDLELARASVTILNGWTTPDESPDEILDALFVTMDPVRASGSRFTGPPPPVTPNALDDRLSHFGDETIGLLNHWKLEEPYWSSPKVHLRVSPVAGKGNWASEDIQKGEVVFKGPIEPSLVHLEEYKRYPEWRQKYVDHFGEQAEEEVLVAPSRGQEDLSSYLNHACAPNIKYDDSYDQMVATRDIAAGEELMFDYATVSSELSLAFECKCGMTNCRRRVRGNDWEDDKVVAELGKEAFWPFLKGKILRRHLAKRKEIS